VYAVGQFLRYGGDVGIVERELLPVLNEIIEKYRAGAGLGIRMDGEGLVQIHAPWITTTWMDARLGQWVITPPQGRPVCVNALWYNALRTVADVCGRLGLSERAEELLSLS